MSARRLLHFTREPIERPYSCSQLPEKRKRARHDKPEGLWVSVEGEDDWETWCRAASCEEWIDGHHCYEVTIARDARILEIASESALRQFSHTYGAQLYGESSSINSIAWVHISATYDGIIIAPYQWACRLDSATDWYYGWDCASGCIWNADAIAALTHLRVVERARVSEAAA